MGNIFVKTRKRVYLEEILKEGYQIFYMPTNMDKSLYIERDLSKEMINVFLWFELPDQIMDSLPKKPLLSILDIISNLESNVRLT